MAVVADSHLAYFGEWLHDVNDADTVTAVIMGCGTITLVHHHGFLVGVDHHTIIVSEAGRFVFDYVMLNDMEYFMLE